MTSIPNIIFSKLKFFRIFSIFLWSLSFVIFFSRCSNVKEESRENKVQGNISSYTIEEIPIEKVKLDTISFDKLEFAHVDVRVTQSDKIRRGNTILGHGKAVSIPDSSIVVNTIGENGIKPPKQLKVEGRTVPALLTPQINVGKLKIDEKSKGRIKTLDQDNGLSSSSVMSIASDEYGQIWIGSGNGISVFDGQLIRNYTLREGLCDINIWSILKARNGDLWIGSEKGLMRYNGQQFTIYDAGCGFFSEEVYGLVEDEHGNIWMALEGIGLCKYTGEYFEVYGNEQGLIPLDLNGLSIDQTNEIWMTSLSGVLTKFDGRKFTSYYLNIGELGECFNQAHDQNGNIWLALFGGGIVKFDGSSFTYFREADGLPENKIIDIIIDHHGDIWAGTYESGVVHISNGQIEILNKENGLSTNRVLSLMEDANGNIWTGTSGGGISIVQQSLFDDLTEEDGLLNYRVNAIFEEGKDNVWFSTLNGLSNMSGQIITNYSFQFGDVSDRVLSMDVDQSKRLWFTSDAGTYILENGQVSKLMSERYEDYGGYDVTVDSKDNVWIGYWEGLRKISKNSVVYFTGFGASESIEVNAIIEDRKGVLWIGSNGDGLYKLENEKIYKVKFSNSLDTRYITSIVESNEGDICFGTNGGGFFVIKQNEVIQLNKQTGLSNDAVYSLVQDDWGRFWIATEKGLNCLTFIDGSWDILKFYNADGLISDTFLPNSVTKDSKGKLWWGTYKGVVILDAKNFSPSSVKPRIYLRDIALNDQFVDFSFEKISSTNNEKTFWSSALNLDEIGVVPFFNYPSKLELPYEFNHATFQFSAIDWNQPNKMEYQYRMVGLDEAWSAKSSDVRADYRNIPEGDYQLKVRALNAAGTWSDELTYEIKVLPPWYRSWWAYVSYGILLFSGLFIFVRTRERNLRRNQIKLEKKVVHATQEIRKQKLVIENKHAEISDSILYAERIQRGLLASEKLLHKYLPEFFIYFNPKDIVSGDFYWAIPMQDRFLLVTADSTGHGVPGAIMSTLNIACIKEAIQQGHHSPEEILSETRRLVIENLFDESTGSYGMDGMDCSLIEFDFLSKNLRAACANNPIWIMRGGECIELAADRYPIGKHAKDQEAFTLHQKTMQSGDVIYSFTDGFADQFGGPKGKKFNKKQLRELLQSICHLPMSDQKLKLSETFNQWRGDLEQIDDVTIIGVKVS